MIPGVYIVITSGAILLRTIGPMPYSIEECSSRIEIWTKLYLLEPSVTGDKPYDVTYQCIEKLRSKRRGKR